MTSTQPRALRRRFVVLLFLPLTLGFVTNRPPPFSTTRNAATLAEPAPSSDVDRDLTLTARVAELAARNAGEIMLSTYGSVSVLKTKSNIRDLVTASDVACQETIRSTVMAEFPEDLFLGEEAVGAGSVASVDAIESVWRVEGGEGRLLWIVDPIDGTTNFQAGLPLFCASIGVVCPVSKRVLVGVIYNPVLDEMTTAILDRGCSVNGAPVGKPQSAPSCPLPLDQAVVNVGYPAVKESTLVTSSRFISSIMIKVRGLRMIACASQVMAWVAQGKLSAYVSWDLNSWDIAAGVLIVRECGGRVWDFQGKDATVETRDLIVSCPEGGDGLPIEIRGLLVEADCLTYED